MKISTENCTELISIEWDTVTSVTKLLKYSENPKNVQMSEDGGRKTEPCPRQEDFNGKMWNVGKQPST